MDEIMAQRQLRANQATKRIPVIAVTVSPGTHRWQQIFPAGFDGHPTKLINVKELHEPVAWVLDGHRTGGVAS